MIDYPFLDLDTGKQVTIQYELGDGPAIGEVLARGGRRLRRLSVEESEKKDWGDREAARARIRREQSEKAAPAAREQPFHIGRIDRPIVSHCLHRWHPYAKAYDEKGRPIINNDAEYRELAKKHNGNEMSTHNIVLDD